MPTSGDTETKAQAEHNSAHPLADAAKAIGAVIAWMEEFNIRDRPHQLSIIGTDGAQVRFEFSARGDHRPIAIGEANLHPQHGLVMIDLKVRNGDEEEPHFFVANPSTLQVTKSV